MIEFSANDNLFMARALELAEKGQYSAKPNPCVGCVIVQNEQIIAEGWHQYAGEGHAEVHALKAAGPQAKGATAYVTLEPCSHHGKTPPCANALMDAGVKRVVVAMQDPNPLVSGQGVQRLREAGIEVDVGLLATQAQALNQAFCHKMMHGVPWVMAKVAMSLDAKTAMATGESQWITGAASREDVHRLRAQSDLILTGIATVLADNPKLTARDGLEGKPVQQVRVAVLDTALRMPLDAALLSGGLDVTVLTSHNDSQKIKALKQVGCDVVVLPKGNDNRVDLSAVKKWLASQSINSVMVEAGAVLNGAMLSAGLLDELIVYMAPSILGQSARGAFEIDGLARLADKIQLNLLSAESMGEDFKLKYQIKRGS
ncbi:MAG: bifunctional diaminohydroxyphosphoribosylaminopyrimidine deaminase/5-amino-6-(5-phosphoribosylamino)uracil reductase RibD [Cycloclasticus sp.]|nr:bifunctional diaminohydroxyphosphoribosylaminopyrimidine deaminase/5-amino-6-(5-phosphoribosylamino)uracil reductase RibD [Cycloclasticus sp.]